MYIFLHFILEFDVLKNEVIGVMILCVPVGKGSRYKWVCCVGMPSLAKVPSHCLWGGCYWEELQR